MHVEPWVWAVTIAAAVLFLVVDVVVLGRRPHEPTFGESARYLAVLLTVTAAFAVGVWVVSGPTYGGEFVAGWLTEYALSVDNLFVFLILFARFGVPRELQSTGLTIGILVALVLRGVFIAVGAAAINAFSWVFYLFGAFLVYTAVKLALEARRHRGESGTGDAEQEDGRLLRFLRRRLPATESLSGTKLVVRENGRRLLTPFAFVIVALGLTDLLFALDSIPAVYGLTQEPYLVLTANIFALLGLRQLYFVLGGLLQRLRYLSVGLSVLLGFIGVKLVLHAVHENTLPFVNGGRPISAVPEIPTWLSLMVILGVLVVTAVASLARSSAERRSVTA